MEEKKNTFERVIILLGGTSFGLASVWLGLKVINFAITFSSMKIVYILVFSAMFIVGCGTFVLVTVYKPNFLITRKITEHKKKLNAVTIMTIASIIVIILMAIYIYISEGLGGKI